VASAQLHAALYKNCCVIITSINWFRMNFIKVFDRAYGAILFQAIEKYE